MEGLEEEDELEVLGDHLESWAKRGDGDELGDVEDSGGHNDWQNVAHCHPPVWLVVIFSLHTILQYNITQYYSIILQYCITVQNAIWRSKVCLLVFFYQ